MIGERENNSCCPLCGGVLHRGEATIPYVLSNDVIVIVKHVPAELCDDCGESYRSGTVTDRIVTMLQHFKSLRSEVSVASYTAIDTPAEVVPA